MFAVQVASYGEDDSTWDVPAKSPAACAPKSPEVIMHDGQLLRLRPRFAIDKAAGNTAIALGLGPAPDALNDRLASRIVLGLSGTLASIVWMWSLSPPPL